MAGRPIFRTMRHSFAFVLFILLAIVALTVGFVLVDNSRIAVEKVNVTLPALPSQLEGYTILQISDLHGREMGEKQASIINAVSTQRFDAVVLLGDMCAPSGDAEAFFTLIEELSVYGKPIYFVAGDEDGPIETVNNEQGWGLSPWVKGAVDKGAIYLDRPMTVVETPARVWLMPGLLSVTDVDGTLQSLQSAYEDVLSDKTISAVERERKVSRQRLSLDAMTAAQAALASMQPDDIVVGAVHHPLTTSFVNELLAIKDAQQQPAVRMDIVLAGHYCGGGFRLPLIGAMHVPAARVGKNGWWPEQELVMGLSQLGTMQQVITQGIGVSKDQKPVRARAFNTPGVTLVRFTTRW